MKRKILSFIIAITLLFSMCSFNVFANQTISVYLDNQPIQFDVPPQIVNGRTMVPLRAIFEKLGATVNWDGATQTCIATTDSYRGVQGMMATITIQIDNNTGTLRGYYSENLKKVLIEQYGETLESLEQEENEPEEFVMDVAPMIIGGRTLVPLRAVSEAFACDVQWNGETSTVNIYSNNLAGFGSSAGTQEEVRVSTAEQFLNSIGSNKKIILTSNYYNLSTVKNVNNEYVEKQMNWDDTYFNAYVFKNVVNMTIQGNAEIVIDDINADVLSFENCKQITLSGLTIGHTTSYEQYQCEGAVTDFATCDSIYLDNCKLYGCGAFGIYADNTTNLNVTNSKIYDCTYTGIWLTGKSVATVNKTDFFDSIHASGFLRIDNSKIACTDCNIYNITCDGSYGSGMFIDTFDFGDEPSNITLTNCSFRNNKFSYITNDDGNKKITFNNCSFQNNIGNMNHNSVVYNNSAISTPQVNQSSGAKSTSDDQVLFLKYLKLGINSQTNATNNLSSYVKYNFDERYKTLFFENLNTGYQAVTSAYELSLKYSDMSNLAEPLQNVLRIYDDIFAGEYSPITMDSAFMKALEYYKTVSDIANSWLQ